MKKAVIGIDIGGTNTKIGIIDDKGETLYYNSISTCADKSVSLFFDSLENDLKPAIERIKDIEIIGAGIGAPNGNYYQGTIEFAPNLNWGDKVEFVKMFEERFNIPAKITNDANAAAIGEMLFGEAQGVKDFIVITLGTGLGSGIVIDGKLVYGHDGFAGELGHTNAVVNGRQCGCGRKGCLETYASATGIKRTIFELLATMNEPSKLRDISFNELESKDIYEAAKEGDPIALRAFEYTGELLGKKLADFVTFSSPKAIFLFGGLVHAGHFLFDPVIKHMEENMLVLFKNKVEVKPSGLMDKNAAVLGSAALAWDEFGK